MGDEREPNCLDCISHKMCILKHQADERAEDLKFQKIEMRLDGMDKAMLLRTDELDRRLAALNHVQRERMGERSLLVRTDVYEAKTAGYDAWCRVVDTRLTTIEARTVTMPAEAIGQRAEYDRRLNTRVAFVALLFLGLQLLMHFLKG